jgi:hypothetical protein
MTADAFRAAALALPGVVESAHMNHPDFRVANRIFATLSADESAGMIKLPSDEQQRVLEAWPQVFTPAAGAWGRQGSTMIRLAKAQTAVVTQTLELAWTTAKMTGKSTVKKMTARRVPERM